MKKNLVNLILSLIVTFAIFSAASDSSQQIYSESSAFGNDGTDSIKHGPLETLSMGANQPMYLIRPIYDQRKGGNETIRIDDFLRSDATKINIKSDISDTKNFIRKSLGKYSYLEVAATLDKLNLSRLIDLYKGKSLGYFSSLNSDKLFTKHFGVNFCLAELIKAFISDWSLKGVIPKKPQASQDENELASQFEKFVKLNLYRALNEFALLLSKKGPDFSYRGLKLREIFQLLFSKDLDEVIHSSRYDQINHNYSINIYEAIIRLNRSEVDREIAYLQKKFKKIHKIKEIEDNYLANVDFLDSIDQLTFELSNLAVDPNLYSDANKHNDYLVVLASIPILLKKISIPKFVTPRNFYHISRNLKTCHEKINKIISSIDFALLERSKELDFNLQNSLLETSRNFNKINSIICDIIQNRSNLDHIVLKDKDRQLLALQLIEVFEKMSGINLEDIAPSSFGRPRKTIYSL